MNMDTILRGCQQFLVEYWNDSPLRTKIIIGVFLVLFIFIFILKIWDIFVSSKDRFKKILSGMYVGYDSDYHLYLKIIDTPERVFSEKVNAVEQIIEISLRNGNDIPKKLCLKLLSDFKESEKIYKFHFQLVEQLKKSEGGDLSHQTLQDVAKLYGPLGTQLSEEHARFIVYLATPEMSSQK